MEKSFTMKNQVLGLKNTNRNLSKAKSNLLVTFLLLFCILFITACGGGSSGSSTGGSDTGGSDNRFEGSGVDKDGDGLIEIDNLTKLNNIRHNLAGTGYQSSPTAAPDTEGCPSGICNGYELIKNLDFDRDGDGSTWIVNSGVYSLDTDDSTSYFNTSENTSDGGWEAIPSFTAIFEGNSFAINNLAIITSSDNLGLFKEIATSAKIRNLRITRALFKNNSTAGTSSNNINTGILAGRSLGSIANVMTTGIVVADNGAYDALGGLVGSQESGSITGSNASADVDGGNGRNDRVGGLVGSQGSGSITASYATGNTYGRNGNFDEVGGLVGRQESGSITSSYANGNAYGGNGISDYVGGLVGRQESGSIVINSYASGNADGEHGDFDRVGGLVGNQVSGSIVVASYASGKADGREGDGNYVGGLVGKQDSGSIVVVSYASGKIDGGSGGNDYVGGLVGYQENGSIVASYATGNADGGNGNNDNVGGLVGEQDDGSIVASYASGNADGGGGNFNNAGGLVGTGKSSTTSYGFGTKIGRINDLGNHNSVNTAAELTLVNAGENWNQASVDTLGAWDFGNNSQNPALKFFDYDGTDATMFACENNPASSSTDSTILIPHCGIFLAGQGRFPVPRISSNIRLATSYANSQHYSLTTINNFNHKQSFGRVEIYNPASGEFGTVCRDNFDEAEAIVACRSLGFNKGKVLNANQIKAGTGAILLDDLHCTGTENSLLECQHNGIGIHNCQAQ